jgi:hypothetical protein
MHQQIESGNDGLSIPLLKAGTKLVIEAGESLYEITVVRPEERLLLVWSTQPVLRGRAAQFAHYIESRRVTDILALSDWILKGEKMVMRLENGHEFISEPVNSVLVEGDGWKYEAIQ